MDSPLDPTLASILMTGTIVKKLFDQTSVKSCMKY